MDIRARATAVLEALEKAQHDPLLELINAAKEGGGLPLDERVAINKELLQYIAPKLKAVDITGQVDFDGEVRVVSFRDMTDEDSKGHPSSK